MRRDVRLLGDLLGEVLRESGGQDLLDDVERLRRASSRPGRDRGRTPGATRSPRSSRAGRWSAPNWSRTAFTVYFHLVNLAEELQRIRTLRERDTGDAPARESLAAAVARFSRDQGPERLVSCCRARVHPVLTAHPTEARRRAVVTALRRISGLMSGLDDTRRGASNRPRPGGGCARKSTCCGAPRRCGSRRWGRSTRSRTVMAVFDETLFRVVPALYRALDRALAGGRVRVRGPGGARVPAVRQLGRW